MPVSVPAGQPLLRVRGVNHSFGSGESRSQVLFDNDLEVMPGELVIMSGPSGSGKTTLLTMIGGLRGLQTGEIEIWDELKGAYRTLKGQDEKGLVSVRQLIGFIFQRHNLFDSLTATQNVQMAQQLFSERHKEPDAAIAKLLTYLGLASRQHYKPAGLSGGLTTPVARQTAAEEVTELEKGLLALGNTTVAGRYVFGGLATTGPVFTSFDDPAFAPATAYTGSPTPFAVRTARDETVRLTTSGGAVFGSSLQAIDDLRQTLAAGNDPVASLATLGTAAEDIRQERASVGGRLVRLQSRDQEIGSAITTAKTLLSDVEDADLTETVTQLAQVRNALEATLTAGATLLQTTILDYLKL